MTGKISRRRFIKTGLAAGAALGLGGWYFLHGPDRPSFNPGPPPSKRIGSSKAPRVIVISIDSL
ncbi:MAG: twin-arginine translocation signal domain-containing protein, partial [Proteobacteria bacterium]|nr:twin-arginine translocation signal domain-containing protein [Pseudomonadota bacterium]